VVESVLKRISSAAQLEMNLAAFRLGK